MATGSPRSPQRIHLEETRSSSARIVRLSGRGKARAGNGRPSGRLSLPETVTEVIGRRLQRLGAECRRLPTTPDSRPGVRLRSRRAQRHRRRGRPRVLDEAITARVLTSISAIDRFRFSRWFARRSMGPWSTGRRQATSGPGGARALRIQSEPHLAGSRTTSSRPCGRRRRGPSTTDVVQVIAPSAARLRGGAGQACARGFDLEGRSRRSTLRAPCGTRRCAGTGRR
jgi:hypothetical protein